LKIDERLKKNASGYDEGETSQKELNNAISELTRENLRLKDRLSYCQAHI
jgi:uncharacterized protein YdcH (DUF465 family)